MPYISLPIPALQYSIHLLHALAAPMEQDGGSSAEGFDHELHDGGAGSAVSLSSPAAGDDEIVADEEKHELVPQLRFPPGLRFQPTEEELVDFYLRAKIDGRSLPLDVVKDVPNFLEWEPHKLVEEYKRYGEKRWYFFTKREKWPSSKEKDPRRKLRVEGVTASWKATGQVAEIFRRRSGPGGGKEEVIGTKRMLTYSSSVAAEHGKWTMHEYVMHDKPMDEWVLCTIQLTMHWNANGGSGRKRKRGTYIPAVSTAPSPLPMQEQDHHQALHEQHLPLLMHEQDRQALHEELQLMAPEETSLMVPEDVAPQRYPDGDHHQFDHVSMQQEIIIPDELGVVPPLMMHQQDYQQTPHEEQHPLISADLPQGYPDGVHHYQLDAAMAQMYAGNAGYMPNYQWGAMVPGHTQDHKMSYTQWQQQQLGYMDQLVSPIIRRDHAQHQFHNQDIEGCFLEKMGIEGLLGTQDGNFVGTGNSQEPVQLFPHESGKIPTLQTSPDSVLEPLPYPVPPLKSSHLYSDNSYDMMLNGTSAMDQETSYGSAADHQFSSVEQTFAGDSKGGDDDLELFVDDFLNHNYDDDNLMGDGDGGNAVTALPEGSNNQASHMCQHGLKWRCGEQQSVDTVRCSLCVPSCRSCQR